MRRDSMTVVNIIGFMSILTVLECIVSTIQADEHSQALIQTGDELRYLVDGISFHLTEGSHGEDSMNILSNEGHPNLENLVRFDPPSLDFREHPIGMPSLAKVVVSNLGTRSTLRLYSISGSTAHFHCSFFQDKVIPAGANTTFDIVFLGRVEGRVDNTLYIHTSVGSFRYRVSAVATPNPYRLRPFLGARVPLNAVFSPEIQLHNPHDSTLQVTEMYSSGGDLHLELPSGADNAPKQLWEIAPYDTKLVMRASFVARVESNHTSYIRIKTNSSSDDYLVLPVEVEVSSTPGLYTTTDMLRFGVLTADDPPQTLGLQLLNYGHKAAHVTALLVDPPNEAISVSFRPVKVQPDSQRSTWVANVTLDPAKVATSQPINGKIVVKTKQGLFKLAVPFRATLLHGSLVPDSNTTWFQIRHLDLPTRQNVSVTNTFNMSVVIHQVILANNTIHQLLVHRFKPVVLRPWQTKVVCELELRISETSSSSPSPSQTISMSTHLTLLTNISSFHIPIVAFGGQLTKIYPLCPGKSYLDLGTSVPGERRETFLALRNDNPVEVVLKGWRTNLPRSNVELVGVTTGDLDTLLRRNVSALAKTLILQPSYFALLKLSVLSPEKEGNILGEIFVETQYEVLRVPFGLTTSRFKISLHPADVIVDSAFPGKISSLEISLLSTFSQTLTVTSVTPQPSDPRVTFEFNSTVQPLLIQNVITNIGVLHFNPQEDCYNDCYLGSYTMEEHQKWKSSLALIMDSAKVDEELFAKRWKSWQDLSKTERHRTPLTLQVDTTQHSGFILRSQVLFHWPSLVAKKHLRFPLTQIGNCTVKEILLHNPSSFPVIFQLLMLDDHPDPVSVIKILETMGSRTKSEWTWQRNGGWPLSMSFKGRVDAQPVSDIGLHSHPNTTCLVLGPGANIAVQLHFKPHKEQTHSLVILIRNNLTVVEAVTVEGEGRYARLKFGNRNPDEDSPLHFELTEKHLHDCSPTFSSPRPSHPPMLTVRRTFVARNVGRLPVQVHGFDIEGFPCQGFGFRVLDCDPFLLMPNDSKKIDIAFTPDFTMSRLLLTLTLRSSAGEAGSPLKFPLLATVPSHLLAPCSAILPRPRWEKILRYVAVGLVVCLCVCVVGIAYLEADRMLRCAVVAVTVSTSLSSLNVGRTGSSQAAGQMPGGSGREKVKPFDLRNVVGAVNSSLKDNYAVSNGSSGGGGGDAGDNKVTPHKMLTDNYASSQTHNSHTRRRKDSSRDTLRPPFSSLSLATLLGQNSLKVKSEKLSQHHTKDKDVTPHRDQDRDTESDNSLGAKNARKTSVKGSNTSAEKSPAPTEKKQDRDCKHQSSESPKTSEERRKDNDRKPKSRKPSDASDVGDADSSKCPAKAKGSDQRVTCRSTARDSSSTDSSSLECESVGNNGKRKGVTQKMTSKENKALKRTIQSEPDFEVSSRGRARKSSNGANVKSNGAVPRDIGPSSLELPYKLKACQEIDKGSKETSKWKAMVVAHRPGHLTVKNGKSIKKPIPINAKNNRSVVIADDRVRGKDSPPPVWDLPRPCSTVEDGFAELANQTASFAMRVGRSSTVANHTSPTTGSSSQFSSPPPPPPPPIVSSSTIPTTGAVASFADKAKANRNNVSSSAPQSSTVVGQKPYNCFPPLNSAPLPHVHIPPQQHASVPWRSVEPVQSPILGTPTTPSAMKDFDTAPQHQKSRFLNTLIERRRPVPSSLDISLPPLPHTPPATHTHSPNSYFGLGHRSSSSSSLHDLPMSNRIGHDTQPNYHFNEQWSNMCLGGDMNMNMNASVHNPWPNSSVTDWLPNLGLDTLTEDFLLSPGGEELPGNHVNMGSLSSSPPPPCSTIGNAWNSVGNSRIGDPAVSKVWPNISLPSLWNNDPESDQVQGSPSTPRDSPVKTTGEDEQSAFGGFDPFSSFHHFWRPQAAAAAATPKDLWSDKFYMAPSTPPPPPSPSGAEHRK